MNARGVSGLSLAALLLGVGLGSFACGGGGGGGGSPAPPPPPTTPVAGITFTAASAPTQESLTLVRVGVSTTTLTLELRANNVEDLYGLAFDLSYPSALLRLDSATEGTWLSADGGVATSFLSNDSTAGTLVVGLTRLGSVAGRTGSGTLLTLQFTAVGTGNGSLTFANNDYFDPNGVSVSGITWAGGSVQVQL
ncbi:MAG: hypothetical protein KDD47_21320 [Acidobacteria bacterium]|nr:hypothetical protein [Acidobacteriota bacterium]